jgi:hypothetical protein
MFEPLIFMDSIFSFLSLDTKVTLGEITSTQDQISLQVERAVLLVLVPVVVAFSFIVFVFYRAKRESFLSRKKQK